MYIVLLIFTILFPFIFISDYHNYTIYKFVFLNVFTLVLWVAIAIRIIKGNNPFKEIKVTRAEIYLFIYIILITISTILSVDINKSLIGEHGRSEGYPVLIAYCTLFIFTYRFVPKEKIHLFIKSFVFISSFIGFYGILQHFKLDPLPRIPSQMNITRSYGFFGNPNFFGSYLTLMLPFSMILFFKSNHKFTQLFYLTSSGLIFASLLYSQTRSGWLGSFVGYGILTTLLVLKNRQYWLKWLILSFTLFIIYVGVNYTSKNVITNRIDKTIQEVNTNVQNGGSGRVYIWSHSIPLIEDYFLHGSGPDTFLDAYPNTEENIKFFNAYVDKAHNEYLQIAITLGIPALVIYLLFLIEIIKESIKAIRKQRFEYKLLNLALLSSVLGYIVQAFFNISVVPVAPYFWITSGLLYSLNSRIKNA